LDSSTTRAAIYADPRLGTILPQEGGPGYSSTGTRDYYLEIFHALRDRRDILIVDKRGTGLSSPINCPEMQTGSLALSAAAACARQLGDTAWFYGTDFAANDIVAVMDALGINDVDFYGDSYGTFVGQILRGCIRIACAASSWTAPTRYGLPIRGLVPIGRRRGQESTRAACARRVAVHSAVPPRHACSSSSTSFARRRSAVKRPMAMAFCSRRPSIRHR
jgi:pimeloyl-ACP methyl ester carboxylesterase